MDKNLVELKRFLKDSKYLIGVGTVAIAVLFTLGMFFLNRSSVNTEIEKPDLSLDDTNKAVFEIYIENEDGTMFTNNNLLNGLFSNEPFVEKIESETDVDLSEVKELFVELGLEDQITPVHAFRNNNGVITVSIRTGNENDNLKVAEFIFDTIMGGNINFLNNKILYPFVEPKLLEDSDEDDELVQINESIQSENFLLTQVRNGVFGIIIGVVISTGLAFIRAILAEKLNYSFAYHVKENQGFFLFDNELNNASHVAKFIGIPYKSKKAILAEAPLSDTDKMMITDDQYLTFEMKEEKTSLLQMQSLTEIDVKNDVSEVILIIKPSKTTRKWYQDQRELLELYDIPAKIIQIND